MVSVKSIKKLRDLTGISIGKCKDALIEANDDFSKAQEILREKGTLTAQKKQDRTLGAGCIQAYIHNSNKVGAMVELLCETDFVAKNKEFIDLARNIALHIAAFKPLYISKEKTPEDIIDGLKKELKQKIDLSKSETVKEKVLAGQIDSRLKEVVLLEQAYLKDDSITVKNLIDSYIQKFGEKIEINNFVIWSI